MTHLVITGHGSWASGVKSGLDMVAGENPAITAVDFTGDTLALARRLKEVTDHDQPLLIFCDLAGGTPFQTAALACRGRPDTRIITGASQPMLLEIALQLDKKPEDLARTAMEAGRTGIRELIL